MTVIRYISLLLLFISPMIMKGQTFTNNTTANIPANGTTPSFLSNPINVTGLPDIDGNPFGLEEVQITFNTQQFTRMELFLVSPNGRIIELSNIRNGNGNVAGTFIFNMNPSNTEIRFWNASSPPSPTSFLPMASINSVNDGTSPNGQWRLLGRIAQVFSIYTNQITSWSIKFGNNYTKPAASNDDCSGAINLVNSAINDAYVSGTNVEYGAKLPSYGDINGSFVCSSGYTENSAWFTWIASCPNDSLNIRSFTRVQTGVVKGNCGGPYTKIDCNVIDYPNNYTYKFVNLTPGTRYYLILDGDNAYYGPFDIRWYPGSCTPLPVTLLNFIASYDSKADNINLRWITATEKNNKEFIIKAKNYNTTSDFIEIAKVKSYLQNTGSSYDIYWIPEQDGFYEFQLLQTDVDGTTTYLAHSFAHVDYPNESFTNILYSESGPQLNIELNTSDLLNLSIIDLSGKIIWTKTKQVDAGNSHLPLPSNIAQALYILEVRTSDKIECRKLLYK
ncbi:T9SS type A sorting domain-containing protein [Sporocytophaga myxococcoides]|uniref:T9SS type A sorting domain-containing protein n=1 Tax=Sporocytophaga myxococcoides TaxID=153721 RepID=UPI001B7F8A17|nr:T9SS type A sorting domain-containing protein [Sporocytophaga myxococcoides]